MRRSIRIPRILRIIEIDNLKITVIFNNGEYRLLDFTKILKKLKITENSIAGILHDPVEFKKVKLENNTLSWSNVELYITGKDKSKIRVPFEIGADILYKLSEPDFKHDKFRLGDLIKTARVKSGLTQQELALMSGTSRFYISKLENYKSDIELYTLQRIVEAGLHKELRIQIR